MRLRRRKLLLVAVTALAIVAALAIAAVALQPWWLRGALERVAGQQLGRRLTIAGPCELTYSLSPRLVARDVTLANAAWGSEPSMARAGKVTVAVDLRALVSGRVLVREVAVESARVLLEKDAEGRGNWQLEGLRQRPSGAAGRPLQLDDVAIRDLELRYRGRPQAEPLTLRVAALAMRTDAATHRVELVGNGSFGEAPWEVAGRLGTLRALFSGQDPDQHLSGSLGDTRIEIRGRVGDPRTLREPDLVATVEGPDIAATLRRVGLSSPLAGAFRLHGRLTPANDGVGIDVEGAVGKVTARARGVADTIPAPARFDLEVAAAGPDAAAVGAWLGIAGLPARPFDVSGRLRRGESGLDLEGVRARVGATSLTVSGALGSAPRFVDTDLLVAASGEDLRDLSLLTRLHLPAGRFSVRGRFLRRAAGLAIADAELRVAGATIRAAGNLGQPPAMRELALAVDAAGPDLARFSPVARVTLPRGRFALRGRLARDGAALTLDGVEARLGDATASLRGRLVPVRRLQGSDLRGRIAGADLARVAAVAGLRGLPAQPFTAQGRLRVTPGGYLLDGVAARVGRLAAQVTGRVGIPSVRDGTSLSGDLRGPALADLAAWGLPAKLPAEAFVMRGRIGIEHGVYRCAGLVGDAGRDHVELDGVLGAGRAGLSGLDVAVRASGPRLADAERFLVTAGSAPTRRLPAAAYSLAGRVRRVPAGFELREAQAVIGDARLRAAGTIGAGPGLRGTDLRFDAEAADASLAAALTGWALPAGRFTAHGRLARAGATFLVDGVTLAIGDTHAKLSGVLGAWPELAASDLRIEAAGADLAATLAPFTRGPNIPAAAFEVSAELAGSRERLVSRRLAARLGGSDIEGSLDLRLAGRKYFEADLRSRRLDLASLPAPAGAKAPSAPAKVSAPAGPKVSPAAPRRLLGDEPLALTAFRDVDVSLRLQAAEVVLANRTLRQVVVTGAIRDGALRVERFEATGIRGGRLSGSLALVPVADRYRLQAAGRLDEGWLLPPSRTSTRLGPPVDLAFELAGDGRSLHELAAGSNGSMLLVVGPGEIPGKLADRLSSGAIRRLFDALNPFRARSDHTDFECGIAAVTITDGKAVVEPIAVRTDKLTVVGQGTIDLDTEAIDFSWTLKPRRGVVSATVIANPYIGLAGTLAAPRIDVSGSRGARSTGAAILSAGLTVVARGLYNRITSEQKVCVDALATVRARRASGQPAPSP